MAKMTKMEGGMCACECPHHKIVPIMGGLLILLAGIVKWMEAAGSIGMASANKWIAIFIILFGLGWLGKHFCKCCKMCW